MPATAKSVPEHIANRERSPPNSISCLLYVFRWNPGRNSALLANLHRPDVCLPASGWTQVADDGVRNYPVTGAFELPFRHFEFQRAIGNSAPQTAHAFYCLSEDRAAESSVPATTSLPGMTGSRSEWTRAERLRTVLEGRRHLGQQVIEAIFVSNESFSSADAESRLRDLVREVVVLRKPEKCVASNRVGRLCQTPSDWSRTAFHSMERLVASGGTAFSQDDGLIDEGADIGDESALSRDRLVAP